MVRRISTAEVKNAILDVGAVITAEMTYQSPVNLEFMGTAFEKICAAGIGHVYVLECSGKPVGILMGMMSPDLNSGVLQGIEFFWGVQRKYRSRSISLLREFEKDCKSAGCVEVMTGSIQTMEPDKMRRLYGHLGYKLHSENYIKRL
jgi:hypothetical protein